MFTFLNINLHLKPGQMTKDSCCYTTPTGFTKPFIFATVGRHSYSNLNISSRTDAHNVQIGRFTSIGAGSTFHINSLHDHQAVTTSHAPILRFSEEPRFIPHKGQIIIQNDVWMGLHASVNRGVIVHNGAVVALRSYVVKDVPPYAIVGGNPAKILRYRFTDEQIADLLDISWWDWDDDVITERKDDFKLPIQEFIDKYRREGAAAYGKPRVKPEGGGDAFLFFPDFKDDHSNWEYVLTQYCERFGNDPTKSLTVFIEKNLDTSFYVRKVEKTLKRIYDGNGDITVQVGGEEEEFFKQSDYYITSRAVETVQRSCMADRCGVKTLSGVDVPLFHMFNV